MNGGDALLVCTVCAAIKAATRLDSVAEDFATAMVAFRGQRVNGAFKRVEVMGNAVGDNFDRLIVFVSTDLALVHEFSRAARP